MSSSTAPVDCEKPTIRYDRQVRLWGTGTQQRLQQTRVHIAGLNGLTCELAKTLTLAGVREVRLEDGSGGGACTPYDFSTDHFVHQSDVDAARCREDVVVKRIRELNPLVCVQAASGSCGTRSEESCSPFVQLSDEAPMFYVADVSTLEQLFAVAAAADAAVGASPGTGGHASRRCGATLVLTAYCAYATIGLFVVAGSAEREVRALFDATSLALLPRPLQLCALRLLIGSRRSDVGSPMPFADYLETLWATVDAYRLKELTDDDVQLFMNHAMEQYGHRPLHESSSGIEFTIGGAFFAQQCISRVAPPPPPPSASGADGRSMADVRPSLEDSSASAEAAGAAAATDQQQPTSSVYQWYATASPVGGDCECYVG